MQERPPAQRPRVPRLRPQHRVEVEHGGPAAAQEAIAAGAGEQGLAGLTACGKGRVASGPSAAARGAGGRSAGLHRAFPVSPLVRDGGGHLGELPDHWAPRHARGSPVAPGAGSQASRGVIWDGWQIEGLPRGGGTAAASGVGGQEEEGSSGLGLDGPQAPRAFPKGACHEGHRTLLCALQDARVLSPSGLTRAGCRLCTRPACCRRTSSPLTPTPRGGSSPTRRRGGEGAGKCRAGEPASIRTEAHTLNPKHPRNLPRTLGIVPSLAARRRSSRPVPGTSGQAHACRDAVTTARKGVAERGPPLPGGRARG